MNNNQKNFMIASNRNGKLKLLIIAVISIVSLLLLFSLKVEAGSDFKKLNRAIAAGTRIIWNDCFKTLPCDVLEHGENIPNVKTWKSHSTLTTGLFKLNTNADQRWKFSIRGDSTVVSGPQLWINVRFYDDNAVLLGHGNVMMISVGKEWQTLDFRVATRKKDVSYGEIYLIKYAELDDDLDAVQAIYIAGLTPLP